MRRVVTAWCVAGMVAIATPIGIAYTEAQELKASPPACARGTRAVKIWFK